MNPRTVVMFVAASFALHAPAEPNLPVSSTAEELKQVFLECERQASAGLIDLAGASQCSSGFEELKHRVFGGDFSRLLAWWQAQRAAAAPSRPAPSGSGSN